MPCTRTTLRSALRLALLVAAVLASLLVSPLRTSATPAPRPTPATSAPAKLTPTNSTDAKAAADAAAAKVAQAQAEVRAQITQVEQASQQAEKTAVAYQQQLLVQARSQETAVVALIRAAQADAVVAATNQQLRIVVAQAYEMGGLVVDTAHLLIAQDPSALLDVATTQQQVGDYHDVLVQRALSARNASLVAHGAADAALLEVQLATSRAKQLHDSAATQLSAAHQQLLALRQQLTKARASQAQANAVLTMFLGGWVLADPARAAALNTEYSALAAEHVGDRMPRNTGKWSAAVGQSVVWRTLQMIGLPYAWAGGGTAGPSRGICAKGDAQLDCHKVGFDCSGLTMYGWGPYLSMPHYAATQYSDGHLHPALTQLAPGDLVFWSSDKTVKGIHHVAMYVGDGNVIQAPNSGDIVRITPLNSVAAGYFGATRPLT